MHAFACSASITFMYTCAHGALCLCVYVHSCIQTTVWVQVQCMRIHTLMYRYRDLTGKQSMHAHWAHTFTPKNCVGMDRRESDQVIVVPTNSGQACRRPLPYGQWIYVCAVWKWTDDDERHFIVCVCFCAWVRFHNLHNVVLAFVRADWVFVMEYIAHHVYHAPIDLDAFDDVAKLQAFKCATLQSRQYILSMLLIILDKHSQIGYIIYRKYRKRDRCL